MRFAALFTHPRLARLHRWAMLWLAWFAAFLEAASVLGPFSQQAGAIAHGWLDRIERRIFTIILLRCAPHLAPVIPRFYGPGRCCGGLMRALMGSRLRRRLRAKDIGARTAALAQDIDALVALQVRRLYRGLTRLAGPRARPHPHAKLAAQRRTAPAFAADTS